MLNARSHLPCGQLARAWSSTSFAAPDLAGFAAPHIARDTRRGVRLLAFAALVFLLQASVFAAWFRLGDIYLHTYALLATLALHVLLSAGRVREVQALNLLAMALLVVSACALVLLMRYAGQVHVLLLLSVAILYLLVPLVPWGLREAAFTSVAIYVMFTSLTFFSRLHFGHVELWALQCTMLSAAAVALVLVGRALTLRKHDLAMCFALERAHASMSDLAERDPLTGARNRRFLERDFVRITALHAADATPAYFGLLDIDHFKQINDASGHQYGDAVLAALAQAFADLDGTREYLVRLGGDEFAFVLCGADPLARLERMLAAAADLALASSPASVPASRPTMSAGLLLLAPDRDWTLDGAYAGADALLYQAKRAGRARICHEGAAS